MTHKTMTITATAFVVWVIGAAFIAYGGSYPNPHSKIPMDQQSYPWLRVTMFGGIAAVEIFSVWFVLAWKTQTFFWLRLLIALALVIAIWLYWGQRVMHMPLWHINHLFWLLGVGVGLVATFVVHATVSGWKVLAPRVRNQ